MAEILEFPQTARPQRIVPDPIATLRADAATLARNAAALRHYGAVLADHSAALSAAKDVLDLQRLRTRAIAALSDAIERAIATGNLAMMLSLKQRLLAFDEMPAARAPLDAADAAD